MTTKLIFNIDKKLKEKAMKKAVGEGLTLSSVLTCAVRAYVEGSVSISMVGVETLNKKALAEIDEIQKEAKKNKNSSKEFETAKDFIAYLSA